MSKEIKNKKAGKTHLSIPKSGIGVGESFELAGITWKILDISDRGYMCLADKLDEPMEFDSKSLRCSPVLYRKI